MSNRHRRPILMLIIVAEIFVIATILYWLREKHIQSLEIFTIRNKYFSYGKSDRLKNYYELKPAIGRISDLIAIPSWLHNVPVYTINQDGLNALSDFPSKKDKDTFRILTLGDSFTFGLFVNTGDSWPAKLADLINKKTPCKQYKKIEVINIALGGYDLLYEIERFRLKGMKYDPDLVVWLLKDEDFRTINEQIKPLVDKNETIMTRALGKTQLNDGQWRNIWQKAMIEYDRDFPSAEREKVEKNEIALYGSLYNKKTVVVTLPGYGLNKEYKKLLAPLQTANKLVFHTLPDISASGGTFPESHPNEKGHALIARDVFEYLTDNRLMPCVNK